MSTSTKTKHARTIRYGEKERVELIEVPVSDPAPDEVQVQALACGICAWDVYVYKHGAEGDIMPGHEGVGRIVKVGRDVRGWREGDRVTGHGLGFTERVNVRPQRLYHLPDDDRPHEHWIVEPVSCVVTGLDHCQAKAGDRIAVIGCGFMGLMLVQGLARSLLDRLIVIDLDPRRLELARQFGATETYNPSDTAFEQTVDQLKAASIDTVVDTSGAQSGLDLASRLVRKGGRINLFGWNHGTAQFPGDLWHMQGVTVVNSAPNSATRNPFPPAIRLMQRGLIDLEPLVTHVVPLDEYPQLLATAAAREDGYIKGVVTLNGADDL
ncbi:MAG: zinc-dependent alcohol dehydrogenase [Phycisphaeraceae bacterium]